MQHRATALVIEVHQAGTVNGGAIHDIREEGMGGVQIETHIRALHGGQRALGEITCLDHGLDHMVIEESQQILVVLQRFRLIHKFTCPFRVLQRLVGGRKDRNIIQVVELIIEAGGFQQTLENRKILLLHQRGHGQRRFSGQNGIDNVQDTVGAHDVGLNDLGGIINIDG